MFIRYICHAITVHDHEWLILSGYRNTSDKFEVSNQEIPRMQERL